MSRTWCKGKSDAGFWWGKGRFWNERNKINEVKKPKWNNLSSADLELSNQITGTISSLYGWIKIYCML